MLKECNNCFIVYDSKAASTALALDQLMYCSAACAAEQHSHLQAGNEAVEKLLREKPSAIRQDRPFAAAFAAASLITSQPSANTTEERNENRESSLSSFRFNFSKDNKDRKEGLDKDDTNTDTSKREE